MALSGDVMGYHAVDAGFGHSLRREIKACLCPVKMLQDTA